MSTREEQLLLHQTLHRCQHSSYRRCALELVRQLTTISAKHLPRVNEAHMQVPFSLGAVYLETFAQKSWPRRESEESRTSASLLSDRSRDTEIDLHCAAAF